MERTPASPGGGGEINAPPPVHSNLSFIHPPPFQISGDREGGGGGVPVSTVLLLVMLKWIRCHRKSNAQSQNASAIYKNAVVLSLRVSANVAATLVMSLKPAAGAAEGEERAAPGNNAHRERSCLLLKGFITGKDDRSHL